MPLLPVGRSASAWTRLKGVGRSRNIFLHARFVVVKSRSLSSASQGPTAMQRPLVYRPISIGPSCLQEPTSGGAKGSEHGDVLHASHDGGNILEGLQTADVEGGNIVQQSRTDFVFGTFLVHNPQADSSLQIDVRGLSSDVRAVHLVNFFSSVGKVTGAYVDIHSSAGYGTKSEVPRLIGYVEFADRAAVEAALKNSDGMQLMGQKINVRRRLQPKNKRSVNPCVCCV